MAAETTVVITQKLNNELKTNKPVTRRELELYSRTAL